MPGMTTSPYPVEINADVAKTLADYFLDIHLRLVRSEGRDAIIDQGAQAIADRGTRYISDVIGPAAAEISALLDGFREGVPASAVVETSIRRFVSDITLADLQGRQTEAQVAAAIEDFAELVEAGYLHKADNLAALASKSVARANLGLAIGTDVQAYSMLLAALAGAGTPNSDRLPYLTGGTSAGLAVFTAQARSLLDDATEKAQRATLKATGNLFKVSVYAAGSGFAHALDADSTFWEVQVLGGGGGGGSARTSVSGASAVGGGGGAGGRGWGFYPRTAGSLTCTVGLAGAGASDAVAAPGGDGTASTVSDGTVTISAEGGKGGSVGAAGPALSGAAPGGLGGACAGAQRNMRGPNGCNGIVIGAAGGAGGKASASAGDGGHSLYGAGGQGPTGNDTSGYGAPGGAAQGAGSGGAGGLILNSNLSGRAGSDGTPGLIVIREYR